MWGMPVYWAWPMGFKICTWLEHQALQLRGSVHDAHNGKKAIVRILMEICPVGLFKRVLFLWSFPQRTTVSPANHKVVTSFNVRAYYNILRASFVLDCRELKITWRGLQLQLMAQASTLILSLCALHTSWYAKLDERGSGWIKDSQQLQ